MNQENEQNAEQVATSRSSDCYVAMQASHLREAGLATKVYQLERRIEEMKQELRIQNAMIPVLRECPRCDDPIELGFGPVEQNGVTYHTGSFYHCPGCGFSTLPKLQRFKAT